jgi:hypothetical protein
MALSFLSLVHAASTSDVHVHHGCTGSLVVQATSICAYDRVELNWSFPATVRFAPLSSLVLT